MSATVQWLDDVIDFAADSAAATCRWVPQLATRSCQTPVTSWSSSAPAGTKQTTKRAAASGYTTAEVKCACALSVLFLKTRSANFELPAYSFSWFSKWWRICGCFYLQCWLRSVKILTVDWTAPVTRWPAPVSVALASRETTAIRVKISHFIVDYYFCWSSVAILGICKEKALILLNAL